MNSRVAVLIVGYRCGPEIRSCLESLVASSHQEFEVHVCENGGSGAYLDLVEEVSSLATLTEMSGARPSSRILETRAGTLRTGQGLHLHRASGNLGYAGGVNAMIERIATEPDWSAVWVLNPDTTVHADALRQLVAYAQNPAYGIVASRLLSAGTGRVEVYAGRWRKWLGRGFNLGWGRLESETPEVSAIERQMDYVPGASMFVTRAYIDAVGLMDERYFLYNEEIDWCFRKGSFRLGYAHQSVVYHQHGATIGSSHDRKGRSALSVYLDERNKLLFTRRFFPREYPAVLVITLLLSAQYLTSGAYRNFGYALRGWFAGLVGRTGRPDWLLPTAPAETARGPERPVDLDRPVPLAPRSRP